MSVELSVNSVSLFSELSSLRLVVGIPWSKVRVALGTPEFSADV